jgi:hypothetical protein
MPHIFPPSRGERRWRALSYCFCAVVGAWVLLGAEASLISTVLGKVTIVWAGFILTAFPAAIAVYWGRYRLESILLPLFGSALAASAINAWSKVFMDHNEELIGRSSIASALICLLVVRGLQLHRIVKAEPWITASRS